MLASAPGDIPTRRLHHLTGSSRRVLAQHVGPVALLVLAPLVLFLSGFTSGEVFFGKDTSQFYYPLTDWFASELKANHIPLWFPLIFGGYPLFADGEIGMAHPLVLLAARLLPTSEAFALLRWVHFALASVLTYWLASVLGLRPFGAAIAGLVFAYSSFLVAHMQHDNILRSAVWLPGVLTLVELALRASGWRRFRLSLLAGMVVGIQLLGVHIQPVLISLLAAFGWIVLGPLGRVRWDADSAGAETSSASTRAPLSFLDKAGSLLTHLVRRLARLWIWLVAVTVGLALSAVQMIPLFVMSGVSMRGSGINYFVATSYAISPPELLTLLFPSFFRVSPDLHWSLWPPQETTLYMGILPLLLAGIALVSVRQRLVYFLALGAAAHLWLALGDYATPNPYYWLWSLPGFSVLRAPARFSLVIILAVACLAGIGGDRLALLASRRLEFRRLRAVRWVLALWLIGVSMVFITAITLRVALNAAPSEVLDAINLSYLTFRREVQQLGAPSVLAGLDAVITLDNPATRWSCIWLLIAPVAVLGWMSPRTPFRGWKALILGIIAADLLSFAGSFYPQAREAEFQANQPAIAALSERNDSYRALIDPSVYTLIGANQLVPADIAAAGGYSSLEPSRLMDYWWGMVQDHNSLLDMFSVRWVVAPKRTLGSLVFNDTVFHPAARLLNGGAFNPAGTESFRADGSLVDRITVIGAVDGVAGLEIDQEVGEVDLIATDGSINRFGLRYGVDLTGYRRSAPLPTNALWAYYGPAFVPDGRSFQSQISGTVLAIDPPISIEQVVLRSRVPAGVLMIHGLGLRNAATFATRSLTSADRAKFTTVYEDVDLMVLENSQALPRVMFVSGADTSPAPEPNASTLLVTPEDSRRSLVLDSVDESVARDIQPGDSGQAELLSSSSDTVSAHVTARSAGFLLVNDRFDPGWSATVDGRAAPVIRANSIMRAVPVSAGEHVVELRYNPWWVGLGLAVSAASLGLVGVLFGLSIVLPRFVSGWRTGESAERAAAAA